MKARLRSVGDLLFAVAVAIIALPLLAAVALWLIVGWAVDRLRPTRRRDEEQRLEDGIRAIKAAEPEQPAYSTVEHDEYEAHHRAPVASIGDRQREQWDRVSGEWRLYTTQVAAKDYAGWWHGHRLTEDGRARWLRSVAFETAA